MVAMVLKTETCQLTDKKKLEHLAHKIISPQIIKMDQHGGRLIVIGSAMEKFIDQKGYGLVKYESESAKKEAKNFGKRKIKRTR